MEEEVNLKQSNISNIIKPTNFKITCHLMSQIFFIIISAIFLPLLSLSLLKQNYALRISMLVISITSLFMQIVYIIFNRDYCAKQLNKDFLPTYFIMFMKILIVFINCSASTWIYYLNQLIGVFLTLEILQIIIITLYILIQINDIIKKSFTSFLQKIELIITIRLIMTFIVIGLFYCIENGDQFVKIISGFSIAIFIILQIIITFASKDPHYQLYVYFDLVFGIITYIVYLTVIDIYWFRNQNNWGIFFAIFGIMIWKLPIMIIANL